MSLKTTIPSPEKKSHSIDITIDSAASDNYLRPQDAPILTDIKPHSGPPVILPDDDRIAPSHQGKLPLHEECNDTARTGTVLPNLKSASLLSVGKLCDDKKMVIFEKDKVTAIPHNEAVASLVKRQKIILQGHRKPHDNLWHTTLSSDKKAITANNFLTPSAHPALYYACNNAVKTSHKPHQSTISIKKNVGSKKYHCEHISHKCLNHVLQQQDQWNKKHPAPQYALATVCHPKLQVVIRKSETKQQLATFLHRALGSPVTSTLLKAMKNGHFVSFPSAFNEDLIKNHLQKSIATVKGHLNQERHGIQSTKVQTDDYKAVLDSIKKKFKHLKSKVTSSTNFENLIK